MDFNLKPLLLIVAMSIGSVSFGQVAAPLRGCERKLRVIELSRQKHASQPSNFQLKSYNEALLYHSALWLRNYVDTHNVNFETTPLPGLVPLVESLKENAKYALSPANVEFQKKTKGLDHYKIERSTEKIQKLVYEIGDHIQENKITYGWLVRLPPRLNFYLDFDFDPYGYYFRETSALMDSDIGLRKYMEEKGDYKAPMVEAPNSPNLGLPSFGKMSRALISHLTSEHVWPLGMVINPEIADNQLHFPTPFTAHDYFHEGLSHPQESLRGLEAPTEKVINLIERGNLEKLDRLDISQDLYERLILIHFEIFHEYSEKPTYLIHHILFRDNGHPNFSSSIHSHFDRALGLIEKLMLPTRATSGFEAWDYNPSSLDYYAKVVGMRTLTDKNIDLVKPQLEQDMDLYRFITERTINSLDLNFLNAL